MGEVVIEFRIDPGSGVAPYRQLVQQVRQALRLGLLHEGDKLPTVKEVVAQVAINPNTVLKAYRELEHEGLAAGRPGLGTFVTRTLAGSSLAAHKKLQAELVRWLGRARGAGLDDDSIAALFETTFHTARSERSAAADGPGAGVSDVTGEGVA
jgi:GntR family transcriptional regulator